MAESEGEARRIGRLEQTPEAGMPVGIEAFAAVAAGSLAPAAPF